MLEPCESFLTPNCCPLTLPGLSHTSWPLADLAWSLVKICLQDSISVRCAPLPLLSDFYGPWGFRACHSSLLLRPASWAVPMLQIVPRAHLPIKTPIFYSVRVSLCIGLSHDESLVEKWAILLDLNDIYVLIRVVRSLSDFPQH